MKKEEISVSEFERQVFDKEGVRIVIRASRSRTLPSYSYQRKAAGDTTCTEWQEARLKPILKEIEFEVVKGDGNVPHGRMKMDSLRNSYKVD